MPLKMGKQTFNFYRLQQNLRDAQIRVLSKASPFLHKGLKFSKNMQLF